MPPAIAAAAAAVVGAVGATGAAATAITIVTESLIYSGLSIGLGELSRLLTPKPPLIGQTVNQRTPTKARDTIYGSVRRAGTCTFISAPRWNNTPTGYLFTVWTLSGRPCTAINGIYANNYGPLVIPGSPAAGVPLGGYAQGGGIMSTPNPAFNKIQYGAGLTLAYWKLGLPTEAAFDDAGFNTNGMWGPSCEQVGCAGICMIMYNDGLASSPYAEGIPNWTADILGVKVWDPRLGPVTDPSTIAYSNNAALCYLDYLITSKDQGGLGVDPSEINTAQFIAAANICDEVVPLQDGGSEVRYACNGSYSWELQPTEIMRNLLAALAGIPTYINGQYGVLAGAFQGWSPAFPGDAGLTDADARDTLKLSTRLTNRSLVNGVRGTFLSPYKFYQPADYPFYIHRIDPTSQDLSVNNDLYLAQDNGERNWMNLDLPFVTSSSQAMRLAKIALESNRRQMTLQFPGKLSCYNYVPGDTVPVTHARFGFSQATFRVVEQHLVIEEDKNKSPVMGCDLKLQQWDPNVYAWDATEERWPNQVMPASNTIPAVGEPYSMEFFVGGEPIQGQQCVFVCPCKLTFPASWAGSSASCGLGCAQKDSGGEGIPEYIQIVQASTGARVATVSFAYQGTQEPEVGSFQDFTGGAGTVFQKGDAVVLNFPPNTDYEYSAGDLQAQSIMITLVGTVTA